MKRLLAILDQALGAGVKNADRLTDILYDEGFDHVNYDYLYEIVTEYLTERGLY